jgi:uncharacterized protein YbjT (DUF2867 family)
MKTAIIIGATGLVGNVLTDELLKDNRYEKVRILVRKKIEKQHPKLEQIIFDFNAPDSALIFGDEVYCCLGTTIKKAGTKEAFRKVDFDYPQTIAKIAKKNGIKQFSIISSMGANPNSKIFYSKVKGEIEEALKQIDFQSLIIVRPSMLLGNRGEFRLGERIGKVFMNLFSIFIPKNFKAVTATKVAKTMVLALNKRNKGITCIESNEIYMYKNE